MTLVIKTKDDEVRTPHLAMTHNELQGGAANGRNVSLLMKSAEMTETIQKALENLGLKEEVVINKSSFYGQIRSVLQSAVSKQFGGDGWDDYAYVEDFNDTTVVFCTSDGLFVVGYTLSDNTTVATLGDEATPVTASVIYTETSGDIMLSDDAEDKLEEGIYTLVKSCTENPSTREHLLKMFTNKQSEVIKMQEEITKAVTAAVAIEKAAFAEQATMLKAAQEQLATFATAEAARVQEVRKSALAAVLPEAQVESVLKALEAVTEEAFTAVVAGYAVQKAAVDNSDLMSETGVAGTGAADPVEVDRTAEILKAKYAPKAAK